MSNTEDVRRLAEQLAAESTPEQQQALLRILADRAKASIDAALVTPEPALGDAPADVRGFKVRLDLVDTKPPVWRRLELPGDLTLDQLHLAIQAAMGWFDSHLHRFRTGSDRRSPYFVTPFDIDDGEDGVLEDRVRLDQVLSAKGDRLWYEYDFGDGWDHVLAVEEVTDEPPVEVRCVAGRLACPPEDCGGTWGYAELAAWVRSGYDPSALPPTFEDAGHAHDWLPADWDPDQFDVDEANAALATTFAPPVPVAEELAALRERLIRGGDRRLTQLLARDVTTDEVEATDAARLTAPYMALLDVIDDGARLTNAGYLPPRMVEEVAQRTGITDWWIGKANREDLTPPIAILRDSARALGLVSVRKGTLAPTAVARRCRAQPGALLRHIASRLPIGKAEFDRQAGWLALAVVGGGVPAEQWRDEIRDLLLELGWRVSGSLRPDYVPAGSPTLDVLETLFGNTRRSLLTGVDPAVAAVARSVVASRNG
ncbi:pRiA4b ORF-3-like protein [Antricoccus suffuscus]|uniref:PRiA4b ORF-3-like protein n=1 Tax=Antricoccus suffuscus TaxID=1629062 RepID=A0A2T1A6Y0_9ACTN|nr:plasmid pRiA4b ORF-3 family protein [Antricoccus suffuscus]PRZ44356.1 pRiA4b ORF-3-like protein [Antricoccus suffuscus]